MKNLLIGGALAAALFLGGCGKADAFLKEAEALKKEACACKDAECATKVSEKYAKMIEKNKDTKGSSDQATKFAKIATEMSECLSKAMGAGGGGGEDEKEGEGE